MPTCFDQRLNLDMVPNANADHLCLIPHSLAIMGTAADDPWI
jgi:hypothetical protein